MSAYNTNKCTLVKWYSIVVTNTKTVHVFVLCVGVCTCVCARVRACVCVDGRAGVCITHKHECQDYQRTSFSLALFPAH